MVAHAPDPQRALKSGPSGHRHHLPIRLSYLCLLAPALLSAVTASSQSPAAMSANSMLHPRSHAHRRRSTAEDHPEDTAQDQVVPAEVCSLPFGTCLSAIVIASASKMLVLVIRFAQCKFVDHTKVLHGHWCSSLCHLKSILHIIACIHQPASSFSMPFSCTSTVQDCSCRPLSGDCLCWPAVPLIACIECSGLKLSGLAKQWEPAKDHIHVSDASMNSWHLSEHTVRVHFYVTQTPLGGSFIQWEGSGMNDTNLPKVNA